MGGNMSTPEAPDIPEKDAVAVKDAAQGILQEYLPVYRSEWATSFKSVKENDDDAAANLNKATRGRADKKGKLDKKIDALVSNSGELRTTLVAVVEENLGEDGKKVPQKAKAMAADKAIDQLARSVIDHALLLESSKLLAAAREGKTVEDGKKEAAAAAASAAATDDDGDEGDKKKKDDKKKDDKKEEKKEEKAAKAEAKEIKKEIKEEKKEGKAEAKAEEKKEKAAEDSAAGQAAAAAAATEQAARKEAAKEAEKDKVKAPMVKDSKVLPSLANAIKFGENQVDFVIDGFKKTGTRVFRFEVVGFDKPLVAIYGSDNVHKFLTDEEHITRSKPLAQLQAFLGGDTNLIVPFLDGDAHVARKRMLIGMMTPENFDKVLPQVDAIIRGHLTNWAKFGTFKMYKRSRDVLTDVIFKVIAGLDPGYVDAHRDYLLGLLEDLIGGFAVTSIPVPIPETPWMKATNARDALYKLYKRSLKDYQEKKPRTEHHQNTYANFLLQANAAAPEADQIGMNLLVRELGHLCMAAFGLFSVFSFVGMTLGKYAAVAAKVKEVVAAAALSDVDAPTYEQLAGIPYLEAYAKEILRHFPVTPFMAGATKKSWEIDGFTIPADSNVFVSILQTDNDPTVYSAHTEFDPMRFLPPRDEDQKAPVPACAYVPQGGGDWRKTHRCLGEPFVHTLIKLFTVRLSQGYTYDVPEQNLQMDYSMFNPTFKSQLRVENFAAIPGSAAADAYNQALIRAHQRLGGGPKRSDADSDSDSDDSDSDDEGLVAAMVPIFRKGKPECLPQHSSGKRAKKREAKLESQKERYEYETRLPDNIAKIDETYPRWGDNLNDMNIPLPPFIKDVFKTSSQMKLSAPELVVFLFNKLSIPINEAFGRFEETFIAAVRNTKHWKNWKSRQTEIQEGKAMNGQPIRKKIEYVYELDKYTLYSRPKPVIHHWIYDDDEFARQRLGGINPNVIRKCDAVPDDLVFSEDNDGAAVKPALDAAAAAGTLFICDYRQPLSYLKSIVNGRFCAKPVGFFRLEQHQGTSYQRLMPVAIQLECPEGLWFVPTDPVNAWLLAKLHFQVADGHYHQFVAHLSHAHLFIEPVVMATQRNIAKWHPLHILLTAHSHGSLMINDIARKDMLIKGAMIDTATSGGRIGALEIISGAYIHFDIRRSVVDDVAERGLDTKSLPISFPYRDDATLFHACLRRFVDELLGVYYKSDDDVVGDTELAEMSRDILENSPLAPDYKGYTAPKTKTELVDLITNIIFIQTLQHSILNYGQFDFYGFIPNSPLLMRAEPPRKKADIEDRDVFSAMPDADDGMGQIGMAHLLSLPTHDTLLKNPPKHLYSGFKHPAAKEAIAKYQRDLVDTRNKILRNSQERVSAYIDQYPHNAKYPPKSVEYLYCDPKAGLATSIQI